MNGLARAFALFTGSSMIGSLTQVVKGKLTALVLGTAGVGVLNQLTSVWSLFSLVAGMGFYNGMVRHLAGSWSTQDTAGFRAHMSSSTVVLLFTSLLAAIIGCIFSSTVSQLVFADGGARAELVCLILLSIPVFAMAQVYRAMLNATKSVSFLVKARIAADVSSVAVLAALIYPLGLRGAVLGYLGLHVLFLVTSVHYTRRALGSALLRPRLGEFSWSEVRRNVGYGINGVAAVAIGVVTTLLVSRWIISSLNEGQNGIYSMALKVATVYLGGLSAAAGGYFFPSLAAAKSEGEMHMQVNETLALYFYVIPPVIVLLMAGGDLLMHVLFTAEFAPAALLLLVILPGDLFRVIAETAGLPLVVRNRLVLSTGLYGSWAALYAGFAAWLLPSHGVLGVAFAYLLSQALYACIVLVVARLALGYRISSECLGSLVRGALLVATVAAFLWSSPQRVAGYVFAGAMLACWAALSRRDPRFEGLLRRVAAKFQR